VHTQWHGVSGSKWALIAMGIRALFEPWKPTHATVSVSVKPMRTTSDLVGPEVLRAPPAAVRGVTTTL